MGQQWVGLEAVLPLLCTRSSGVGRSTAPGPRPEDLKRPQAKAVAAGHLGREAPVNSTIRRAGRQHATGA